MPPALFVAGIGTDVGKTLVSAWLCIHLKAAYWKPVQAGLAPPTDAEWVRRVAELPADRVFPETHRLEWPASPHAAAAKAGIEIHLEDFRVPQGPQPLIVEAAGGLMVPLNPRLLMIDLVAAWQMPAVLVVKTYLGCINHSLLSLEALRTRGIPLAGIVFNDGGRPESEEIILHHAQAPLLGRIPVLPELSKAALAAVPMLAAPAH